MSISKIIVICALTGFTVGWLAGGYGKEAKTVQTQEIGTLESLVGTDSMSCNDKLEILNDAWLDLFVYYFTND